MLAAAEKYFKQKHSWKIFEGEMLVTIKTLPNQTPHQLF